MVKRNILIVFDGEGAVKAAQLEETTPTGTTARKITAGDVNAWLSDAATLAELSDKAGQIEALENEVHQLTSQCDALRDRLAAREASR